MERTKAYRVKIQNVISTAELGQPVDPTRFNAYDWGKYDPNYYAGRCGYVKDKDIEGRVSVFLSGKMISTGAKSITKSLEQLEHTNNLLASNNFTKKTKINPKIRNVVATLDLHNRIDLNLVVIGMKSIIFEPEQFPGIIHKVGNGTTCLIFSSGKIVIAGAKSEAQVFETADILSHRLEKFGIEEL